MEHLAVTAIDRPYLPGLVALHNSILRNSPNTRLAAMVYGDEDLAAKVRARGVSVVLNPQINANLPVSEIEPVANPAMYARLLIPSLFGDAVWLDADQVVLKPLDPLFALDMGDLPCAAVPAHHGANRDDRPIEVSVGGCPIELGQAPGIYSGLIRFNASAWTEQRVTERCFDLMNSSGLTFHYVVQSVMDYALLGKFYRLPLKWQRFGNRMPNEVTPDACVVHWHGSRLTPWTHEMNNAALWRQYA